MESSSMDEEFMGSSSVDAIGTIGYQKCTAATRMLAYGMVADSGDEYLRMTESKCLPI